MENKKELILRVVYDEESDAFVMDLSHKGFDKTKPTKNSLLIASLLDIARMDELNKIKS